MATGKYFNIQRYCLHDGDGIRTTVFLKGCPLRCAWCHNPESQRAETELLFYASKCTLCGRCLAVCPNRSIASNSSLHIDRASCTQCGKCAEACFNDANELCGKEAAAEEIFKIVQRDRIFYETSGGGMTISGGEPSCQSDFTLALLRLAQDDGIDAAIETCGAGSPSFFEEAFSLNATFLYDIKAADPVLHKKLTGADNAVILQNLRRLFDLRARVILRLPLIPGVNDSERDIALLCDFLSAHQDRYEYAEIMPYHNLGISKEQSLGRDVLLPNIAPGTSHTDTWQQQFQAHGCEGRVSK